MRILYKIKYGTQNEIPIRVGVEVQVHRTCQLGATSSPKYVINSLGDIATVTASAAAWIAADITSVTTARVQQLLNNAMKTAFQTALGEEIDFYVDIP